MNFIDRIKASLKTWRFSGQWGDRAVQTPAFFPNWPSQVPIVQFSEVNWDESSLVMAAVNWTGTVFGEPYLCVSEQMRDGSWTRVEDHPLVDLWEYPNPDYTGATMMKAFAYYWIVYGNVYIGKRRDANGRVRELYLLPSETIEPRWPADGSEFISYYEMKLEGVPMRVERNDLIHFRYGLDPRNHRIGMSPIRSVVEEIMTDEAAITYARTVLGNTGIPPFIVSPKPNADNEYTFDAQNTNEELIARTQGDNRGKPVVFSHPLDVSVLAHIKPSEMSLTDMHKLPQERVCAVLGIPALALGFGFDTHATYSNYKTALEAAWNTYAIPTLKLIATEIEKQLLPEFDRKGDVVQFDTSEIWALQQDQNAITERELKKYNSGVMTLNEARAALDMPPLDGGDELKTSDSAIAEPQMKQFTQRAQYDELRDWWKRFGPRDAQGILDAEIET